MTNKEYKEISSMLSRAKRDIERIVDDHMADFRDKIEELYAVPETQ